VSAAAGTAVVDDAIDLVPVAEVRRLRRAEAAPKR
jgi:hypothetical protein